MGGSTEKTRGKADLLISDLEERTGVERGSIHYYIRKGLLSPPVRAGKTVAYYTSEHVKDLKTIRHLRKEGYPLSVIARKMKKTVAGEAPAKKPVERPDRRQEILEQAVKIFARKGYHGATVGDVTTAVGIGYSTFYIYFPGKKELFLECIDETLKAMFADVIEEIKNESDPIRRLHKRVEVAIRSHPEFIDILSALKGTMEDDPRLEGKRREIYSYIIKNVTDDLEEAMRLGMIPRVDAEILAYTLVTGILETASVLSSSDDGPSIERLFGLLDTVDSFLGR